MSPVVHFVPFIVRLVVLVGKVARAADNSTALSPIAVAPSQYWDGNDGPWSSFCLTVGTPAQNLRVLPSSSGSSLWVVLPEGCIEGDPDNCAYLRGYTFNINQSSTWDDQGFFQLPLYAESQLGYSGNADFGFDTMTLGWQGSGALTLTHQVVAGFATTDFYIGNLGLTPRPVNFTDFNNPQKSILGTLRNESKVASSTWAYTAGAWYREPEMFGSLTFGGYDSTRFVPNGLSLSFGEDTSRDIIVELQSVTTGTDSLLPDSITIFIDSTVPHIWLPIEACSKFESVFGIVWDNATDLYLVNDTLHNSLLAMNPNITFTLGEVASEGEMIDIVFPYGAFDLTITLPTNTTSRYFPIRRAHNDTQFTLGRTFLQETYLIVDYDRSNFSVSQALFPNPSVAQNLVSIYPPENDSTSSTSSGDKGGHDLRIVVIVAIVAVSVAVVAISLLGLFTWYTAATTSRDSGYASMVSKSILIGSKPKERDSDSVISFGSWSTAISSLNPAGEGGAVVAFAEILLNDKEIRNCVEEGFARMDPDRFERNFARLLKGFAADLRREAGPGLQKGASHGIRIYRAYVASLVRRRVLGSGNNESQLKAFDSVKTQVASRAMLERFLAQQQPTGSPDHLGTRPKEEHESDSDSQSDDVQHFPNVEKMTDFLVSSLAFKYFKARLREFTRPMSGLQPENSLEERSLAKGCKGQGPLKQVKNALQRFLRPPVRPGFRRVEWTCGCGHSLYMDFNANSSRSPQTIQALQNHKPAISYPLEVTQSPTQAPSGSPSTPVDVNSGGAQNPPKQPGPVFGVPGTLGSRVSSPWSSIGPTGASNAAQTSTTASFLELCVNKGNSKALAEINVTSITTDGDLFRKVKEHYLQLRGFRARFWLLKPAKVSWVRFSVENHHRVGILHKPRALPPKSEVDERRYIYHPCPLKDELPIDPEVFLHYVFCLIACPNLIWLPRIPRKLGDSVFASNEPVAYGWGLYIDECPHLCKILLLNVVFLAGSIVAAILWDLFKGDLQGAMGLATLIIMFLNTIMTYYILKWGEE